MQWAKIYVNLFENYIVIEGGHVFRYFNKSMLFIFLDILASIDFKHTALLSSTSRFY